MPVRVGVSRVALGAWLPGWPRAPMPSTASRQLFDVALCWHSCVPIAQIAQLCAEYYYDIIIHKGRRKDAGIRNKTTQ